MKALEWSPAAAPNEYCRYDHSFADTPFGRYQVEWKGWKDAPGFTVAFAGDPLRIWGDTLAEVQTACEADWQERIRSALVPAAPSAAILTSADLQNMKPEKPATAPKSRSA